MTLAKHSLFLAFSLFAAACSDSDDSSDTPKSSVDIVQTAVDAANFKTLVAAVQAADLVSTLKGPGPFTVFAPPDSAFEKLPAGTVDTLLKPENKAQLASVLTYHVVPGKLTSADLTGTTNEATVQGALLSFSTAGGKVKVNDATVVNADIDCSNGVIHAVDSVLLPP